VAVNERVYGPSAMLSAAKTKLCSRGLLSVKSVETVSPRH